jgi:regulator of sigma E protease
LIAIGGLLALVFIHELGHFVAAKAVGMRVTKFYVGFPPAVVKRTFRGTEYGIGAIPLGGFVRIVGMGRPRGKDLRACQEAAEKAAERRAPGEPDRLTPALERARMALDGGDAIAIREALALLGAAIEADAELIDAERVGWCTKELERIGEDADPRAYWRMAVWRRITAIVAGPAANLLAAFVVLTMFYGLGIPNYVATSTVQQVQVGSPAQRMGLKPGDVVVGIQGKRVKDVQKLRTTIQASPTVTLLVRRGGRERTLGPQAPHSVDGRRLLGFVFDVKRDGTLTFGPLRAAHLAEQELWLVTKGTATALKNLVYNGDRSNVQGVVGIVRQQSTAVGQGLYLEQLAWLSLSLALFNLLPFLPLDGGHVLFALIERLRRRPLSRELYERVSLGGIAVFVVLFLLVLQSDVGRILDGARPGP